MDGGIVAIFAAFVIVVILLALLSWRLKVRRVKDLAVVAQHLGLRFSARDPYGLDRLSFALMRRGDGRGAENVMSGLMAGRNVTLFDYWYYDESTDAQGHSSRSYTRYSCGVAAVDATCPHLTIGEETLLTRIAEHLGLHDIEYESEEFNRRFNVKCGDRKFASAFIDPQMMDWLMSTSRYVFEANGGALLCATGRLRPDEVPSLLEAIDGFASHVPAVVGSLYPAGPSEARA